MYSPLLLDHFQNPRNAGDVADPDASVQIENPACGDILKLTVRVADRRIAEIRFRAKGCVPAIACASLLTELVQGITIAQACAGKSWCMPSVAYPTHPHMQAIWPLTPFSHC
jgi:nitrogen fixation NifU-like protein